MSPVSPSPAANALRALAFGIDGLLRRWYHVFEFSQDPGCILRASCAVAEETVVLPGLRIAAGDRFLELHLWNEQLPVGGSCGLELVWASRFRAGICRSLTLLAEHLEASPALADVQAVRACTSFVSRRRFDTLADIGARFGFAVPGQAGDKAAALPSDLWGDLWVRVLILACHAGHAAPPAFRRDRQALWMSREVLLRRYHPTLSHDGVRQPLAERSGM